MCEGFQAGDDIGVDVAGHDTAVNCQHADPASTATLKKHDRTVEIEKKQRKVLTDSQAA